MKKKDQKVFIRNINFTFKKSDFSTSISEAGENVCFISLLVSFVVCIYMQHFFDVWCVEKWTPNSKYVPELTKRRRSKVQEKNFSCGCTFNFNQWKTFSETCKPMRAWFTNLFTNLPRIILACDFSPRLFKLKRGILSLIQTRKRYPTSLDKIRILTWKPPCELNS